jgi:hypothetical protein
MGDEKRGPKEAVAAILAMGPVLPRGRVYSRGREIDTHVGDEVCDALGR